MRGPTRLNSQDRPFPYTTVCRSPGARSDAAVRPDERGGEGADALSPENQAPSISARLTLRPGPIDEVTVTLRTYLPFDPLGLALTTALVSALKLAKIGRAHV